MQNFVLSLVLIITFSGFSQCDNGTNFFPASVYDPVAGSWGSATTNSFAGQVIQVSVVLGDDYEFSTCSNFGGAQASYDTQLTLRDDLGAVLSYNDDDCGLQSYILWTASYTGTVYLHLSEYSCISNTTSTQVSIRRTDNSGPVLTSYIISAVGSTTVTPSGCSGNVFDPGENADYPNSANGTMTILPETSGSAVRLDFMSFNTEEGYDFLSIYNGTATTDLIGTYDGISSPGVVTSSSADGALTLLFTSDGSVQRSGFKASISCVVAPSVTISNQNITLSACPGLIGASQSFTVEGTNMESALNIEAPSGVELSFDNTVFTTSLSLGAAGAIASTIVYARQSITSSENSATIDITATNLASKQISVVTTVLPLPYLVASASSDAVCQGGLVDLIAAAGGVDEIIISGTAIPDNDPNGLTSVVSLSNTLFSAAEVTSVEVNLTHTFTGDLTLRLTAPDLSSIILSESNGLANDNYTNTVFRSDGADISLATAPFSGVFAPEEQFTNLTGSADGNWTLTIVDDANMDTGSLIDWRILKGTPVDNSLYSWSSDVGSFSSSEMSPTGITVSESTDFSVTATGLNGCVSEPFVAIVNAQIPPVITSLGNLDTDVSVCGVSDYVITMDNTSSGTWEETPSGSTLIQPSQGAQTIIVNPMTGFNRDITLKWTENDGICADYETEVVVRFHQPASITNPDTDSYLWNGLIDSDWSIGANWYKWNGVMWEAQSTPPSSSTDKINLIENDGLCVSSEIPLFVSGTINTLTVASNSKLNLGSASLVVNGDFVNDGIINSMNSTLSFVGSGDQVISGSGTISFSDVIVNNGGDLILDSDVTIEGELNLQSDILINESLIGPYILTLGTSSENTGSLLTNGGVVLGKLKRYFANNSDSYIFPLGYNGSRRDVSVGFVSSPGIDQFLTVSYNLGYAQLSGDDLYQGLPLVTADGQLIQNYDGEGYWEIIPGSLLTGDSYDAPINSKGYNLDIRCNGITGTLGATIDPQKVRLIKSAGPGHTSWEALTHLSISGDDSDFIVSAIGSGFSFFGAGSDNDNALPVELISFNGDCIDGTVDLEWKTASESYSSDYELEYSRDGFNWYVIHTEPASGFSNELITYSYKHLYASFGDNYYRLIQNDIDGASVTYDAVVINANCMEDEEAVFTIYPNPSSKSFQIVLNNSPIEGEANLNIIDTKGNKVFRDLIYVNSGFNTFLIEKDLSPGIYFISVENGVHSTAIMKQTIR